MVFPLGLAFNVTAEVAALAASPTQFRFFQTAEDYADQPQFDLKPDPTQCTAANRTACAMKCENKEGLCNQWVGNAQALANNASYLKAFSAVCYMTVRRRSTRAAPRGSLHEGRSTEVAPRGGRRSFLY